MSAPRSRGRRPGSAGQAKTEILTSARTLFGERGFERTTVREIARVAGVDAELVLHYFGSKDELFAAALQLPMGSEVVDSVLRGPSSELGERLTRRFLALWEDPETGPAAQALLRAAASYPPAAAVLRELIERMILDRIASVVAGPAARLRVAMAGSQLIGLAIARHVVRVEPLAGQSLETVVAAAAPSIQRYLIGEVDGLSD